MTIEDQIQEMKEQIAKHIKHTMQVKGISLRKLAEQIEGMSYSQISRITSGKSYNIESLFKLFISLGLTIEVKNKK